jgi:hypothetical protein
VPSRPGLTPERVFLALSLVFGAAFVVATPPLDPGDERRHLQRVFLLSEGDLRLPGAAPGHEGLVPRSLLALHPPYQYQDPWGRISSKSTAFSRTVCRHAPAEWLALLRAPLAPEERRGLSVPTVYSPVSYAAAALMMAPGRWLELPPLVLLYLGRAGNLLGWVGICWLALRFTPIRKWSFAVLCLTPIAVFRSASVAADPATVGIVLLFLVWVLRLAFPPEPSEAVSPWQIGGLVGLAIVLGLAKPGYGVMAASVVLIPGARFRSRSQQLGTIAGVAAVVVLSSGAWAAVPLAAESITYTDPRTNLESLLGDPGAFLSRVGATLTHRASSHLRGLIGILGHHDVPLPSPVYLAYPVVVVLVSMTDGPDPRALSPARRVAALAIFGLGTLGLLALLDTGGFGSRGAAVIPGFQGIYLVPLLPLLVLCLPAWRSFPARAGPWCLALFCAAVQVAALVALVRHYY